MINILQTKIQLGDLLEYYFATGLIITSLGYLFLASNLKGDDRIKYKKIISLIITWPIEISSLFIYVFKETQQENEDDWYLRITKKEYDYFKQDVDKIISELVNKGYVFICVGNNDIEGRNTTAITVSQLFGIHHCVLTNYTNLEKDVRGHNRTIMLLPQSDGDYSKLRLYTIIKEQIEPTLEKMSILKDGDN